MSENPDEQRVIRLMTVDDSHVVRDFVRLIVRTASDISLVAEAETGAQALNQLDGVAVDVVTLDLGLPDVQGLDLLDLIIARGDVGVVVLSAGVTPFFQTCYPDIASFDKDQLLDRRELYLRAIRDAGERCASPRRFP